LAGVGVNLLQSDFPQEIQATATSVYLETGRRLPIEPLAQQLRRSVDNWVQVWRREGFSKVLADWQQADATAGHRYRLPSGEIGVAQGIDPQGNLLLEVRGQLLVVPSAEPVRGLYAPKG
jgi:BirA family biotin operon repressor/biotin-[acetyl-CoA-carboxylase] ligase